METVKEFSSDVLLRALKEVQSNNKSELKKTLDRYANVILNGTN